MELAGPLAVWLLAAYRAKCWVSHDEPRHVVSWPLSLAAFAWLGLLASRLPEKAMLGPVMLEGLSFGLIPAERPAAPAPPPAPEPVVEPPPAPEMLAPAPPPEPVKKPAKPRRPRKKRAPEPVPDL
jgi:outer membrane biosynthesis protein TonB